MRVLVTGADGFTGRHLLPVLAAEGHEVHALVQRVPEAPIFGATQIHAVDITRAEDLDTLVAAVRPHRVVHLAAIAFVASNRIDDMYAVNVVGTRHLLEALARLEQRPTAVLLASSANIYGNAAGVLSESTPPAPANDYAVSKLAMEYVASLYAAKLPLVICRPFNYTGVGQSEAFLLPKIVGHARAHAARIELGNLDVSRDFSDVRDVVAIYAALLNLPATADLTINVCSGKAYSLREVIELVTHLSGHVLDVVVNPAFVRANEVHLLRGERSRLEGLLPGLAPPIPLAETLRWMLEARLGLRRQRDESS
jgi:nucleoside-diphosphate-sugar epimerase